MAACTLLSSREPAPEGKPQPSHGSQPTPRAHLLPGELAWGQFLCPLPRQPGLNGHGRRCQGAAVGPGTYWHLILSPFSALLNFPVCSRTFPPEGPGGASRDKNWGCVLKKVLRREGPRGCWHQPPSRPLPSPVLHHPLRLPQGCGANSLEGSLEPLTHCQGLPVCTDRKSLARRAEPCPPWSPQTSLQVQRWYQK